MRACLVAAGAARRGNPRGGAGRVTQEARCGSASVPTNGTRIAKPIATNWPTNETATVHGFCVRPDTPIASNILASD
jgi:hypothetical protein